ncbi:MAG: 30S ribosomal protein S17 [archaeon]|nr:30S ribosomal protein S17 [archaeon]
MKNAVKNIGIQTKTIPEETCSDDACPFHGHLKVRGRIFQGTVVSVSMDKSIVVEWNYTYFIPKYESYERRKTKVVVHKPPCFHLKKGDTVRIGECRPVSKTKKFVVIEKL